LPTSKTKNAILGGGDIAFPLIFSSAVLEYLIIKEGLSKIMAFSQSLIITVFVAISLTLLFTKSEKGKFYPAMPFLSMGCFVGLGVILIINVFL
jgi:ABC-type transport system involved in cytochrome c biogenesis permease subunit